MTTPEPHSCGCPETDGKTYHQRGTCTDPAVAALDWYADGDRTASPDAFDSPDGRTYSDPVTAATPGQADPVHLMTIEMGAWCGATGPRFNGRASSAWREVTCTDCHDRRTAWLLVLAWDMLQTMGPSPEALEFAVRAGRLGVRDEQGRPLAMACTPDAAQEPHAAPEPDPDRDLETLAAARQEAGVLRDQLDAIRELLDEIGVMAANAPEDGDSFGLLEEIAMRIAAAGVPDSTPPEPTAGPVTVTATRAPRDMVRVDASWPSGDRGEWLVRLQGDDFSDGAVLAGKPSWSWTGYLAPGGYSLHVEGHEPASFEVPS